MSKTNRKRKLSEVTYYLSVHSSHELPCGTEVKIQLIGEDVRKKTGLHSLIASPQNYLIEDNDVGLPLFVRFVVSGQGSTQWECDEVFVTYRKERVSFPIYDWIQKDMKVARGAAIPYTKACQELKDIRKKEIKLAKSIYEWHPRPTEHDTGWGLPRYVNIGTFKELPNMLKMDKEQSTNFEADKLRAMFYAGTGVLRAKWKDFLDGRRLENFHELYEGLKPDIDPPSKDGWDTDVEFGRQQLIGFTPFALKRCTSLPHGYKVTDEDVRSVIEGKSLTDEMSKGKIFVGDYHAVFDRVERNKNGNGDELCCPNAIGLFYVNSEQHLMPFAIQLEPNSDLFTRPPKDSDDNDDWLLAKMYYRVATANMHEWYYHFLLTHNVMEPFSVAMFRCLPRSHPLYKLLRPHLQTVSSINTLAREELIAKGTQANNTLAILGIDLARSTYKTFKLDDLNIPKVIKNRGLDNTDILPNYPWRDDALDLWSIIEKFVDTIVTQYYRSDSDVAEDVEIQAFVKDVAVEGLGWQDKNDLKGMPTEITNLKELIELCTIIIFTSSAGHAAANFPQFEIYKFIPNSPMAMRLLPHKKGEANRMRIMDSLPDVFMSITQVIVTYTLSGYANREEHLGKYPMKLFTDNAALVAIEAFQDHLKKYAEHIKERNKKAGRDAYVYLLPENVPNSIAI